MRYVEPQPELRDFDMRVRQPGLANPSEEYWRRCHDDLYKAYNGYCAYLAVKIPRSPETTDVGGSSVDHFLPKSLYPDLIFEWSNYRLSSCIINRTKKDKIGILDPFCIKGNWFFVDIITGELFSNPGISSDLQKKVNHTIHELGLNKKIFCNYRINLLNNTDVLKEESPFLYEESARLNILNDNYESSNE